MTQNNPLFHSYNNQIIWIIGASSGIGYALAERLASLCNSSKICLSARRADQLETLKQQAPNVYEIFPCDIGNYEMVTQTCQHIIEKFGRIDRVICMAGVYMPTNLESLDIEQTEKIIKTNLMGAFYLIKSVLPQFRKQSSGQIALCGSVAGYVGLPNGQPYSATKAGIINLAQSLAVETDEYIDVKLINPGFVKTPLTDKNSFKMPCMITATQAAQAIATGLLKKQFEITFPKRFTYVLKFIQRLPYQLQNILLKRL